MSFTNYTPDTIETMFFKHFRVKSYLFNGEYTMEEMVGNALSKVNEVIKETNDMGEALVIFEQYVLSELSKYDQKIIDEVMTVINEKIADGTLAELINSLFDTVNQNITNLDSKVEQNKTDLTKLINDDKAELLETIANNKNEADNKFLSIDQEIKDINYKRGTINITISPSQTLYNKGETINGVNISSTITLGSDNITELKIYKNGSLLTTLNNPALVTQYLDGNIISSDTEYYIEINDGKNVVTSNKIKISFVNNFYYGVIDNVTVTETLIKSLTGLKTLKDNLQLTFNCNDKKILFAQPYGDLSSIVDTENYDMIDGFTKSVVNLTLNGVSVPYTVYVSNYLILDTNVVLKFEY